MTNSQSLKTLPELHDQAGQLQYQILFLQHQLSAVNQQINDHHARIVAEREQAAEKPPVAPTNPIEAAQASGAV